jgi:hypothetical protein
VKPSRLFLGALLTVATACGDSTGPTGFNGSLSFSHSGATSGTFNASGSAFVGDPFGATWAAAVRDDANQSIAIAANLVRSSTTSDNVAIEFPQVSTGSVAIANGSQVAIVFGRTQSGAAAWSCDLTSGTVVVTSLSSTRARGSFSGTGSCLAATGGPVAFTVTNGSFDVPAVSGF